VITGLNLSSRQTSRSIFLSLPPFSFFLFSFSISPVRTPEGVQLRRIKETCRAEKPPPLSPPRRIFSLSFALYFSPFFPLLPQPAHFHKTVRKRREWERDLFSNPLPPPFFLFCALLQRAVRGEGCVERVVQYLREALSFLPSFSPGCTKEIEAQISPPPGSFFPSFLFFYFLPVAAKKIIGGVVPCCYNVTRFLCFFCRQPD